MLTLNPIKFLKNRYYRNAEMVSYWKEGDSVEAKLTKAKDGHTIMQMKGEKYAFSGHPRGTLLYGKLSPLKHEIKNRIFNETWALLEAQESEKEIDARIATAWGYIFEMSEKLKYDMVPFEKLCPPMKELHRALTAIGCDTRLRDVLTFIFQEDDAYRFRFQWMAKFFPHYWKKPTLEDFTHGLSMLEEAEVIDDMKERERLFKRVMLFMVRNSDMFLKFLHEADWNKIRMTDADKYFFRAKYFKVDYPEYDY